MLEPLTRRFNLKKLKKYGGLKKLGLPRVRINTPKVHLPPRTPGEQELLPAVYPPFRSVEEVLIWDLIQGYDEWWQPMVPLFGGPGVEGGTEIDFYNDKKRIALYADGPPHLLPTIAARDIVLRKAVENVGLKVLSFKYRVPVDVQKNFPQWYQENIG